MPAPAQGSLRAAADGVCNIRTMLGILISSFLPCPIVTHPSQKDLRKDLTEAEERIPALVLSPSASKSRSEDILSLRIKGHV